MPFSVTAPCLVWMLVDGEEAEFKGHRHPVALAYLSNTASGFGSVAWYQNQWKPDKNGKPKNGPFVYKRFFTNATSTPSKKNGKRPVPVTKLTWDVQHRAHGYMGRIYGGAWLRDGLDYVD